MRVERRVWSGRSRLRESRTCIRQFEIKPVRVAGQHFFRMQNHKKVSHGAGCLRQTYDYMWVLPVPSHPCGYLFVHLFKSFRATGPSGLKRSVRNAGQTLLYALISVARLVGLSPGVLDVVHRRNTTPACIPLQGLSPPPLSQAERCSSQCSIATAGDASSRNAE
jgi:hypothetical protein